MCIGPIFKIRQIKVDGGLSIPYNYLSGQDEPPREIRIMDNAAANYTAEYAPYNAARAAWGERPTQANYTTMRSLYAAWQRAERAEEAKWAAHRAICESRGLVTA